MRGTSAARPHRALADDRGTAWPRHESGPRRPDIQLARSRAANGASAALETRPQAERAARHAGFSGSDVRADADRGAEPDRSGDVSKIQGADPRSGTGRGVHGFRTGHRRQLSPSSPQGRAGSRVRQPADVLRDGEALRRMARGGLRRLECARRDERLEQARCVRHVVLGIRRRPPEGEGLCRALDRRRAAAARRLLPRQPHRPGRHAQRDRRGRRAVRHLQRPRRLGSRRARWPDHAVSDDHGWPRVRDRRL